VRKEGKAARLLVSCRCCGTKSFLKRKDFGEQPLCFDYGTSIGPGRPAKSFPLGLGECQHCGVIQLTEPVPPAMLVPHYSWVQNKEPEDHLPQLASDVAAAFQDSPARVLLISYFDDKFGEALAEKIPISLARLDPKADLGITLDQPGQALIQEAISHAGPDSIERLFGQFNLVVCCRMLEHAHETKKFVSTLKKFLTPNGRLLLEIPESSKSLMQGDVGMLWEEHTNYFTEDSVTRFALANGLATDKTWIYEYPQEDALALLLKVDDYKYDASVTDLLNCEESVEYSKKLSCSRGASRTFLEELRGSRGKIVIFGAGHRAVMFINLLQIADVISAVIDDDERKQGLFIPGTQVPIESSSYLGDNTVGSCIFAIGIDAETKLAELFSSRFDHPLQYYSISPDSSLALPIFQ
jgi:hypothetical protein